MDWKQIVAGIIVGAVLGIGGTFFLFQGRISMLEAEMERLKASDLQPVVETKDTKYLTNIAPLGNLTVSSVEIDGCNEGQSAVDGIVAGWPELEYECNEWASANNEGDWLRISFGSPRMIHMVILYDRPNSNSQIREGSLIFSDGSKIPTGELPNDGTAKSILFEPRNIEWIEFSIERTIGPFNGLAEFQIYGD